MTREDLFCAIGAVEEKDLLQAQKKRIAPILWIVTAAAVLLGVFLLIYRERPISHSVSEEKPSWEMDADILVQRQQLMCALRGVMDCEFAFTGGLAVQARVVEALPDTYLIPEKTLSRDNYRVLRMKTAEVIAGKDVPKEFWFLLPERYDTDLSGLDLLISLDQVGVEDYLLFNATQQQYETFSLVFSAGVRSHELEPYQEYAPDPTAVSTGITLGLLPFRNEALHWPENDEWAGLADSFDYFSVRETSPYPIAPNTTLDEAKAAIRQSRIDGPFKDAEEVSVRYADEYNMGIRLTDVDTPKDGVFSQIIHQYEKKILLCRIVDGFYANECYMYYDDGRIEASDTKFTPEEIAALPKLAPVVEQVLQRAPETGTCRTFVGYYYKTNQGDLFGVVQAEWEINWETKVTVNMLLKCDGSVTEVSTKVLEAYLSDNRERAALQQAWDGICKKAYRSNIIYENRDNDYIALGRETILHENFTITCNDSWYAASEIGLMQVAPSAIGLKDLISETPKYWPDSDWSKERIVSNIRYAWQLEQDLTDHRKSQYLLYMQDGTLLLVRCYDYSQIFNDPAVGLQIPQIVQLDFYYDY